MCRRNGAIAGALGVMLALSACDNSGTAAPGAVSEGEARALDEAAEMLEERGLPEGALPPTASPELAEPQPPEDE